MSKFNSTPLTPERLREVLDYDPMTGVFSRVLKTCGTRRVKGSENCAGYLTIRIDGKAHYCHRLAWVYVYGTWPFGDIDHIDGDKANNRIGNLRDVTRGVNMQNQKKAQRRNRSSGLLGAFKDKNNWSARIGVDGVVHHLGNYDTPEEAHEVYLGAKRLIHPGCTI